MGVRIGSGEKHTLGKCSAGDTKGRKSGHRGGRGGKRKGQKESRKATKLTKTQKVSEKSSILMETFPLCEELSSTSTIAKLSP